MIEDKPCFKSLGESLVFSYYNWPAYAQIVKEPALSQMQGTDSREQTDDATEPVHRRDPDIGPIPRGEGAARVAATVERYIEQLPDVERWHLHANYLVSGKRAEAKVKLVERILPTLSTGIHNRRLIGDLVSKFYGMKGKHLTMKALRERYEIGRHKLEVTKGGVDETLREIAQRAETKAYYALQARGIIR